MTLLLLPFPAAAYAAWRETQVERRRRWQFTPLCGEERGPVRAREAVDELAPVDGLSGTYLSRVLADDRVAGWVWLAREDGDLVVLDAEVDASVPGTDLLALLESHARAVDARAVVLDRMVEAPTTEALAAAAPFTVTSQTLVRHLGEPLSPAEAARSGAGRDVLLFAMTRDSFADYYDAAIDEFARELRRNDGLTWSAALARSRKEYEDLLPQGLDTVGHALLDVVDQLSGERVGGLWIGLRPPKAAFVYDLYLQPSARGQGLGRGAMRAATQWCQARDVERLGLNVVGTNAVARNLYGSLGFGVVVEAARWVLPETAPVVGPR